MSSIRRFSRHFILSFILFQQIAGVASEHDRLLSLESFGGSSNSKTVKGFEQFFDGDVDGAAKNFNSAVSRNAQDFQALYGLGIQSLSRAEYQQALELFCTAIRASKSSPWSELFLAEAYGALPYCSDDKPFTTMASDLAVDTGARPRLRELIHLHYSQWLLLRGNFSAAMEAGRKLNFIVQWQLGGPFDNRDKAGFATAYEPEHEVSFERSMPGRNRRVSWFNPELQPGDGRVMLSDLFEPHVHTIAYGVSFVKAPKAGWAVLHAGCGGALSVWVNEKQAIGFEQYHFFGFEKTAARVYLHEGWNQILVKSAVVEDTDWGFAVRLSQPAGGPIDGLVVEASANALEEYNKAKKNRAGAPEAPESDLGLVPLLKDHLEKHPKDVFAASAYALMLSARNIGELEQRTNVHEWSKAVALAPKCPYLQLSLAEYTPDNNESRHALEAVLAANPELPQVYELLTWESKRSGLDVIAEQYARQAIKKFGADGAGVCSFLLGELLAGRGRNARTHEERAEAATLARLFVAKHPYRSEAWTLLIDLQNTQTQRRALIQEALTQCAGIIPLRDMWASELEMMGKDAEAAEYSLAALPAQPLNVQAVLNVARRFHEAGNTEREMQLLESASKWGAQNPELLNALALARHHAGKTAEAVQLFKEILRIKPNSPHIKDYLAQLDKGSGIDTEFFRPYDIALKDLTIPDVSSYPHDNVVHILNQQVVRLNPNCSSSSMHHIVEKLLRPQGTQELSQHYIYYDPDRQVVDILKAAVITPDGRELSRAEIRDRSTSAAMGVQTRIYDEHYLKEVVFNDLEPGAIIDLQYTIRDNGDNIYGDYFADTFYLASDEPVIKSQYVLDLPKSVNVQTQVINSNVQAAHLESTDTSREVFKWETQNTAGIVHERSMAPVIDQLPHLQVTTMKSWQEVGQWYWNLAKEQVCVNDEMRAEVEKITHDCKTDTEKVRAIQEWEAKKIRYLGIEFGRNGYRPHKAEETYKALYGDCKDSATLLVSLLKAANINANLVLIRTVNAGAVPANSLPMPNLFNHCICYVPNVDGKEYWIDGTAKFHQLGEVPYADQDAQVLVAAPDAPKFVRIPKSATRDNHVEQKFAVSVDKSGSGSLILHEVRTGQFAPHYRNMTETPGQYERYMKDYGARRLNGAELTKIASAQPDARGPMWTETEFRLPVLASQSGERKAIPANFEPLYLSQRYAAETHRKFDLELYFAWSRSTEIVYQLDKSLNVVAVPQATELSESFGKYGRKIEQQGDKLTIREEFEFTKSRISVAEYDAFRGFCNKVDSLMDQKVLLETK